MSIIARRLGLAPLAVVALPTAAAAQATAERVAANVRGAAALWYQAIEWFALIIGLVVLWRGIAHLVQVAHDRRAGYGAAVAMVAAAVGLLYLPSAFLSTNQTIFASDTVLAYSPVAGDESSLIIDAVIMIVRLIGLIGFVRGWIFLSRAGSGAYAQQGMVGRGVTFIVGGVLAMNVIATSEVIANLFELDNPLT